MTNLTLITGGVRSGKSIFAESIAREANKKIYYIATMPVLPEDAEQQTRIDRHRMRRPADWVTFEAPYTLPDALSKVEDNSLCVIDCLSVYVSNILLGDTPQAGPTEPYTLESKLFAEVERVMAAIAQKSTVEFVAVTNEVGWGVVPDNQLGRAYRDFLGMVNQSFAKQAQAVWMTCVGIPVRIK